MILSDLFCNNNVHRNKHTLDCYLCKCHFFYLFPKGMQYADVHVMAVMPLYNVHPHFTICVMSPI